jgi:hypothetical protein
MRGRLILPRRSRTAGGGRNVTPSYCGGTQRGTNSDSSRRGLVTDAGHARLGAKGVGVDIRCAASLSSWITTVRRRATVFAGASVSPKPRVFVDSGHAGEKVTTARLIAVEIVRKNTDQVGCVVNPRRCVVETIFRMDRTKSLDCIAMLAKAVATIAVCGYSPDAVRARGHARIRSSSAMCCDCPPTPTITTQCDQVLTEYFVRR